MDLLEFLISRTRRWLLQLNIEQLCNLEKYNTYKKNTYDVRANINNQKVPCIKYLRSIALHVYIKCLQNNCGVGAVC